MDIVVIDSNCIVERDWHLDGVVWTVLLHRSATGRTTVIVPEIVVREVVGAHSRTLRSAWDSFNGGRKNLGRLGVAVNAPEIDLTAANEAYEEQIRSRLADAAVDVRTVDVDPLDLADRAIQRIRPFNQQGGGFRDSLVWEHVIDAASNESTPPVVLISSDNGFGGEGLHDDLRADFEARSWGERQVTLFKTIDGYLKDLGQADARLLAQVLSAFDRHRESVEQDVVDEVLRSGAEPIEGRALVVIEALHELRHLLVDSVVPDVAGDGLAMVTIEGTIDADVYVEAWEHDHQYLSGSVTLDLVADVTFDPRSGAFGRVDLETPVIDLDEFVYWNSTY